jgi:RNA polymerase sigma-70 factor (ECF subfamily)
MTELPDTRESLLLRVGDPANAEAWREFVAIYRPAIYRLARRRGLQDCDADDLAQRVLITISGKITDWRPTSSHGAFRAWLSVIARNLIVNALTRRQPDLGKGGSSVIERLQQQPAGEDAAPEFDDEQRRAIFRLASEQVRQEFQESTWLAFWLTAVEAVPIGEAARRLGKNEGVVYASRSRVMRRLKERVRDIGSTQWES